MGPSRYVIGRRRLGTMLGALGVAGLVLGACGGSSSSSTTGTTTNATTGGSGTTPASSDPSGQINSLATSAQNAEHATFKAVYTTSGSGAPATVTIEQKPPKSFFSSSSGSVINNGTTTYFCSTSGATTNCVSQAGANPLAALAAAFSPAAAISAMQQAQAQVEAHIAGYNVNFDNQSFAGVSATCINISAQSQTAKYCVTADGILAYSGTTGNSFALTSYSTNVSDNDFSLPAGATVVTVP